MNKHELRQIIREEIQKATVGDTNYKKLASKMLDLVEEIVDDYLEDFDSTEDKKAAKSVDSEDSLIKFYKQVLKNLKTSEVNAITIGDIKKEVKKLFSTNNITIK
jgi:phosphate uptake regulator